MNISEQMQLAARKALANMDNGNRNPVVGYLTGGSPNRYAQAVDERQASRDNLIIGGVDSINLPY